MLLCFCCMGINLRCLRCGCLIGYLLFCFASYVGTWLYVVVLIGVLWGGATMFEPWCCYCWLLYIFNCCFAHVLVGLLDGVTIAGNLRFRFVY